MPEVRAGLGGDHYGGGRSASVSASSCAVRIANSSIASGEKFCRNPPIQSSVLSAPSTVKSLFKPELPPVDTAVIRAFVGSDGSSGSVPGAR